MTDDDKLQAAIEKQCRHCANGHKPRFRSSTREFVHDFAVPQGRGVSTFSTVVCGASKLRRFGLGAV